jgi:hypothetical protein
MQKHSRDIKHIQEIAVRMRRAIDEVPRQKLPFPMASFPLGACGDGSLLLGTYLKDRGFPDFEYILGERGNHRDNTWISHAWLGCGSLIVDMTADQFPDISVNVIVADPSKWHRQFSIVSKSLSDFRLWDGPGVGHLHTFYRFLTPVLFGDSLS